MSPPSTLILINALFTLQMVGAGPISSIIHSIRFSSKSSPLFFLLAIWIQNHHVDALHRVLRAFNAPFYPRPPISPPPQIGPPPGLMTSPPRPSPSTFAQTPPFPFDPSPSPIQPSPASISSQSGTSALSSQALALILGLVCGGSKRGSCIASQDLDGSPPGIWRRCSISYSQ